MRYLILVLALAWLIPTAQAASPEEIDQAIAKAKQWLYARQKDGHWEDSPAPDASSGVWQARGGQWGGTTALATYALLSAGEKHNDPRMVQAVNFLKKAELRGVYALGLRCQVWLSLPPTTEIRQLMSRDAAALRAMMITQGEGRGKYPYARGETTWSHGRSQYAVLGMWAAAQAGIEVGNDYWSIVEKGWLQHQDPSGAWAYYAKPRKGYPLSGGMTAVGIATLFITQEQLHATAGAQCRGNFKSPAIDLAMKWMADHFDEQVATDKDLEHDWPYATLYAVERVGVASGYKRIGPHDWYDKGTAWLLKKQGGNGNFGSSVSNSCFALLFLARGRAPLAMNKLDYTVDPAKSPPWNQRPRDVANVSRWIGRQIEQELNWQIVNLDATVEDLHEAQVLYVSGNQALTFREEDKAKLRRFVEEGGLILGHADCAALAFATSFRKLGSELFPNYEFRELPAEHPIYTNQQFMRTKWRTKPAVLSLSNGVRELMILLPQGDLARTWQLQNTGMREEHWQLAANILMYSVDKTNLRQRGVTYAIARDGKVSTEKSISLARIEYDANWDPEPGGWTRLSNLLHNRHRIDLQIKPTKLVSGALDGIKVAHLTGTTQFTLDEATRAELKRFVESGGTLIVDAAGGSGVFAQSAETELAAMFSEKLEILPPEHPVYSVGGKIPPIRYRSYAQKVLGSLKDTPRVLGIERDGRVAMLFSREDLSAGLVGQPVDGIVGYDPATATEIMSRIILYAAK